MNPKGFNFSYMTISPDCPEKVPVCHFCPTQECPSLDNSPDGHHNINQMLQNIPFFFYFKEGTVKIMVKKKDITV